MQTTPVKIFDPIRLPLPKDAVLARLGRHRHKAALSVEQTRSLESAMRSAFDLCCLRGAYALLPLQILDGSHIQVGDWPAFESKDVAGRLEHCREVLVMAAFAGGEISKQAAHFMANHDGFNALVFDAVGSESADAAMDFVEQQAGRELRRSHRNILGHRFSPGYQDFPLACQTDFCRFFDLASWGICLTADFIFVPEKTVTAMAGVR